jgi:zinc/manganese transport system permease protein
MNLNILDIMLPAFAECLVLVGIHSYLGIHVIKRKVIFVDLSLAQIAALGTTVAFLFGIDPASMGAYWFSLGFTFIGAAIFSVSRFRHEKIPQEAIIGLVYALAAAVAILVIDRAPQGPEHIKEILTGNILWVKWKTIGIAASIYILVGIFHFVFRDKFILISNNPEKAYQSGVKVRMWDFLFYVTFGIVIAHSVKTAGVLLVFVFLVVPAIATLLLTDKLWLQLVLGWSMGTIVSFVGLLVSYFGDLPSGPTVVATYGLALLLLSLVLYIVRSDQRQIAFRNLVAGIVVLVLISGVFYGMVKIFEPRGFEDPRATLEQPALLVDNSAHEADGQATDPTNQSKKMTTGKSAEELLTKLDRTSDAFEKIDILKELVKVNEKEGISRTIQFLESETVPFLGEEAISILKEYAKTDFGYDSAKSPRENSEAIQKFHSWWREKYR